MTDTPQLRLPVNDYRQALLTLHEVEAKVKALRLVFSEEL